MGNRSRGLRETVIRAMAKVGLVWAVAVLGALFMTMASQGQPHDGGYSLSSTRADAHQSIAVTSRDAPSTAGLVLALAVLAGGASVLVVGACRGGPTVEQSPADDPEPVMELPFALGVAA